jgi:DNA polymerase III psi subunit
MQNTNTDLLPIYQETLYTQSAMMEEFVTIGSGINRVAILIMPKDNEPDKIALLQKMIAACKLIFEECAIIEVLDGKNALDCISLNKFNTVLSYGIFINNGIIELPVVAYKPFAIGNCNIICSHSLSELISNDAFKNALWQCLKAHFKL